MSVMQEMAVKPHKAPLARRLYDQRFLFLLMLPALVWVILICYAPMTGLYMAFTNYKPTKLGYWHDLTSAKFVGLQWFEYFFQNGFANIMRNTLITSVLTLLFSFPAPIILALMLNEVSHLRFKKVIQTVSYMPHFISMVVVAGLIKEFCSSTGVVAQFVQLLGGTPQSYISQPQYFRAIFTVSQVWQTIGFNSIVFLAALSGIDMQLYEAAKIDGAGRLRQLWHVTLPGIIPTIIIMLILRCGAIMNVNFEKVLLLYSPSTYATADVISTYVYRAGIIKQKIGYSTAVGLFNSVVSLMLVLGANYLSNKFTDSGLF